MQEKLEQTKGFPFPPPYSPAGISPYSARPPGPPGGYSALRIGSSSPPPTYDSIVFRAIPTKTPSGGGDDEAILSSILRAHPWRRAWGCRPHTLHRALHRAALIGHKPLVRAFISAGVEIRYTSKYAASKSSSAIHAALLGPEPSLALELVDYAVAKLDAHLDSAATQTAMRELLGARDGQGCTPLHLAAGAGETEIVRELLARGADVDVLDALGRSPLHMAARYSRVHTIRLLLAVGADAQTINQGLWQMAGEEGAAELGSYNLISQLLMDVADELGYERGLLREDCGIGNSQPPVEESLEMSPVEARVFYPASSGSSPPSLSRPALTESSSRRHAGLLSAPNAFCDSTEAWVSQPVLSPEVLTVLSSILSEAGKSPLCSRRPPPSMWDSPEYAAWLRDCETLQAEHKAQKGRKRDGDG